MTNDFDHSLNMYPEPHRELILTKKELAATLNELQHLKQTRHEWGRIRRDITDLIVALDRVPAELHALLKHYKDIL